MSAAEIVARLEPGGTIGRVEVDMGKTACQVPFSPDSIRKCEERGSVGKRRQTARCQGAVGAAR